MSKGQSWVWVWGVFALFCVAVTAAGCQDSPPEVCHDFIDRWARRAESCGYTDYATAHATLEDMVRAHSPGRTGTCDDVERILDRELFEEECLPWVDNASCESIWTTVEPACNNQFVFRTPE